jgi:hypothetical protein
LLALTLVSETLALVVALLPGVAGVESEILP